MKIAILITTYNREISLNRLLTKILPNFISSSHKLRANHVYIMDDHSGYDIRKSLARFGSRITIRRNSKHLGKKGYFKTVSHLFHMIQGTNYDYYFMIPDDMMPQKGWIEKSLATWQSICHERKICLSIYSDASRYMMPSWNLFKPIMISPDIILSQWMDLCFMAEKEFFELLGYQVPDPGIDYDENPLMSSGVGRYITRFMIGMELLMFHMVRSLMSPMNEAYNSQMNQDERQKNSRVNKPVKLVNKKYAGMATIPGREEIMLRAVKSILPQVDHLFIGLNNYKSIPVVLKNKKITPWLADNSLGDAEKFRKAMEVEGFYFSVDDDIIYPPTYVRDMIKALKKRSWRALITHHGRNMRPRPIKRYYKDHLIKIRCLEENNIETPMDVPGSGVAAWHTDLLEVDISLITHANMGDIWLAKFCHDQHVPIWSSKHPAGYFGYLHPPFTIYEEQIYDDQIQSKLYNSIK